MSNCRSNQILGHDILTLGDTGEIKEYLTTMLGQDNDMSENEDYFKVSDDESEILCHKLGYYNDAEMHVGESMKEQELKTADDFDRLFDKVFGYLSKQEYYGDCDYEVIDLKDGRVSVAWVVGGNDQ